LQNIFLKK